MACTTRPNEACRKTYGARPCIAGADEERWSWGIVVRVLVTTSHFLGPGPYGEFSPIDILHCSWSEYRRA